MGRSVSRSASLRAGEDESFEGVATDDVLYDIKDERLWLAEPDQRWVRSVLMREVFHNENGWEPQKLNHWRFWKDHICGELTYVSCRCPYGWEAGTGSSWGADRAVEFLSWDAGHAVEHARNSRHFTWVEDLWTRLELTIPDYGRIAAGGCVRHRIRAECVEEEAFLCEWVPFLPGIIYGVGNEREYGVCTTRNNLPDEYKGPLSFVMQGFNSSAESARLAKTAFGRNSNLEKLHQRARNFREREADEDGVGGGTRTYAIKASETVTAFEGEIWQNSTALRTPVSAMDLFPGNYDKNLRTTWDTEQRRFLNGSKMCVRLSLMPVIYAFFLGMRILVRRSTKTVMDLFFVVVICTLLIKISLKDTIQQERPAESCARGYGFPSLHATCAMGLLVLKTLQLIYATQITGKSFYRKEKLEQRWTTTERPDPLLGSAGSDDHGRATTPSPSASRPSTGSAGQLRGALYRSAVVGNSTSTFGDVNMDMEVDEGARPDPVESPYSRAIQRLQTIQNEDMDTAALLVPPSSRSVDSAAARTSTESSGSRQEPPHEVVAAQEPAPRTPTRVAAVAPGERMLRDRSRKWCCVAAPYCWFFYCQGKRVVLNNLGFGVRGPHTEQEQLITRKEAAFWLTIHVAALGIVGPCRVVLRDHTNTQILFGAIIGSKLAWAWILVGRTVAKRTTRWLGARCCGFENDLHPDFVDFREMVLRRLEGASAERPGWKAVHDLGRAVREGFRRVLRFRKDVGTKSSSAPHVDSSSTEEAEDDTEGRSHLNGAIVSPPVAPAPSAEDEIEQERRERVTLLAALYIVRPLHWFYVQRRKALQTAEYEELYLFERRRKLLEVLELQERIVEWAGASSWADLRREVMQWGL